MSETKGVVWQPIETAPRDGRLVLLYLGDGIMACRRWENNHWRGWDAEDATHWQPLPEPPALAQETRNEQ